MSATQAKAVSQSGRLTMVAVKADGRGRRWSASDNAELVKMYEAGATPTQIGAHFGVSKEAIVSKLRDWKVPPRHRKPRMDELAEHVANGRTIAQAARRMGMTYGTAKSIWQNIKRRLGPQAV